MISRCWRMAFSRNSPRATTGRRTTSLDDAKKEFEREYPVRLLKQTRGNITHAAKLAQRNRSEFYSLLHRHGLEPSDFKAPLP